MACKDCVCYVDGHSKSGAKVPAGNGLCTMHNQDVTADSNCNSCNSVNKSGNKVSYGRNNYECSSSSKVPRTPRIGMLFLAILLALPAALVLIAAIAVSLAEGSEGLFMWPMVLLFGIPSALFFVLSLSPKESAFILGKTTGLKKKSFLLICISVLIISFVLIGTLGDAGSSTNSGTGNVSVDEESKADVTSIADFKTTEYEMLVGESLDFTVELRPKDLTSDNVGVEVSNANVLSISDMKFVTEGRKTILTFKCAALGEGEATLVVKSNTGDKSSNTVSFKVSTPPLVTAIGKFSPSYAIQEVGDKRTVTCYMKPLGLTQEDFVIENSDDGVISVTNIAIGSEDDKTVLTFDVTGIGVGKAAIKIKGADGKTESNELQFTINEKDTSPTVYVTPYGEKYHFSAACAGKNATKTTQNKAIRSGKDRCGKCG